jgi:HEPN domain-containing protein
MRGALGPRAQGKKKLYWYSRYGKIQINEQTYRHGRRGRQLRPFAAAAGVRCRGYSRPLQRAITDFGADHSFAEVVKKMREHYRIEVPISAGRLITQGHASALRKEQDESQEMAKGGVRQLILEMDGTNLPIVEIPEKSKENPSKDRRKQRHLCWREARLCLARRPESVTASYRATMGGALEAGEQVVKAVIAAGGGQSSRLHGVGDAARWIIKQVEERFGGQATYLIDFYHLSDYLAAAGEEMAPGQNVAWLKQQQEKMKANRDGEVREELRREEKRGRAAEGDSATRACERYLSNHAGYFDYQGAIEKGLPIGSGEIESGHRWVIQKRLKISGAWWKEENADKMLALRVARANNEWPSYWEHVRQATA